MAAFYKYFWCCACSFIWWLKCYKLLGLFLGKVRYEICKEMEDVPAAELPNSLPQREAKESWIPPSFCSSTAPEGGNIMLMLLSGKSSLESEWPE